MRTIICHFLARQLLKYFKYLQIPGKAGSNPGLHKEVDVDAPIMVIDDLEASLHMTKLILKRAGYSNILTYECPVKALTDIENGLRPFFIITDYRMPSMTGLELLKAIEFLDAETDAVIITGDPCSVFDRESKYPVIEKGDPDYFNKLLSLIRKSDSCKRPVVMEPGKRSVRVNRISKIRVHSRSKVKTVPV